MAKLTLPEDEVAAAPGAEVKKKKRKVTAALESPSVINEKPKKTKKKVVEAATPLANGHADPSSDKKKKQKPTANGVAESNGVTTDSKPKVKKRKLSEEPSAEANGTASADIAEQALNKYRLSEEVKAQLKKKGILDLFPIQSQSLDSCLDGFDMVGRARTGQGKTLAFVLPLVEILAKEDAGAPKKHGRGPRVIVLAPTRELAKQVIISHFSETMSIAQDFHAADDNSCHPPY